MGGIGIRSGHLHQLGQGDMGLAQFELVGVGHLASDRGLIAQRRDHYDVTIAQLGRQQGAIDQN